VASTSITMRVRVKVRIVHVLTPIQLAAIAINAQSQTRRIGRNGSSALTNATSSSGGTCSTVFAAISSMPIVISKPLIHLRLCHPDFQAARSIPAWGAGGDSARLSPTASVTFPLRATAG
jgi:hypothetical protein